MTPCMVWVAVADGKPVEIFDNQKQAVASGVTIVEMEYAAAVESIRLAIFVRDNYECTHCGDGVTWEGDFKGDMHEQMWRGRGGHISVANGRTLCPKCHHNDPVAGHGNRSVQWSSDATL